MAAHAKLSASGAHRWATCAYSVKAESGLPDSSSIFAAEGTAAHELAEHCLNTGDDPHSLIGQSFAGIEVDAEMAEHIAGYVAYVKGFNGEHFYEVRVDFSHVVPEGFGTCDASYGTRITRPFMS